MSRIKPKRATDAGFLMFLRSLPCLCTGVMGNVTAHHLMDTGLRGMGLKSPDRYSIPLDWKVHDMLHRAGDETLFLAGYEVFEAKSIADQFYESYLNNDYDGCYDYIIRRFL
ncbi:DUF968 domain-containing protein [Dyadobacter bucti]|uniref:DUF968 domain-containing protein n=1 Tax=Dyadobacter bucti TaxID=2572203 RepID=UPI0035B58A8B